MSLARFHLSRRLEAELRVVTESSIAEAASISLPAGSLTRSVKRLDIGLDF
jgi:hypothetical protein